MQESAQEGQESVQAALTQRPGGVGDPEDDLVLDARVGDRRLEHAHAVAVRELPGDPLVSIWGIE